MRKEYLVTGGTGSLGREVLVRLLKGDSAARIAVLARGSDRDGIEAKRRGLLRFLAGRGATGAETRVDLIAGDLSLPGLGLATGDADRLRRRVTHAVHAAARIELGQSLDAARAVNVEGTGRVLAFAGRCPRLQRFVHVSTAYVAGDRQGTVREGELERGQGFRNAYERSKYEAERLVATRRDAFPITIVRPSIVVGDSRDGRTCHFGTIYYPLKLIVKGAIRRIPGDPRTRLDLVPADYAADVIAALCRAADAPPFATYHAASGAERALPVGELVEAALAFFGPPAAGSPRFVPPRPAVAGRRGELGHFFAYLEGRQHFDSSALVRDLGAARARCPDPRAYLAALFTFCAETDWGRRSPGGAVPRRRAA